MNELNKLAQFLNDNVLSTHYYAFVYYEQILVIKCVKNNQCELYFSCDDIKKVDKDNLCRYFKCCKSADPVEIQFILNELRSI